MTGGPETGSSAVGATGPSKASHAPIGYYATLTIASTALWTAMVTPVLVLLPEQAGAIAGGDRIGAYALVAGAGGIAGSLAGPMAGRLSDRTRSRFGRRRPWIVSGALAGAVSLVVLGNTATVAGLLTAWIAAQISCGIVLAALSATIPDRMPEDRLGTAAACLGVSWALAPIIGTALAAALDDRIVLGYSSLGVVLVAACVLFAAAAPDPPPGANRRVAVPDRCGTPWVALRNNRNLAYAWCTRFLVALGQNMAVAFLYFFLQDAVRYADEHPGHSTADGLLILTLLYAATAVAASIIGGTASDRLARRKPFVAAGTVVFALGTSLGAFQPTWPGVIALALLTGLGFGVYEAADMALVTQILPSEADRARDLSLINMATTLGITLGPIVAAPVLSLGGYTTLYLASGLLVLLGTVFVRPVRGVR